MAMNEKMMILKMLDEGKITTEESIKLIKACDQSSSVDDIFDNVKKFVETAKIKVEPYYNEAVEEVKKAYKKAEPKINEAKESAKKAYKKVEPKINEVKEEAKKAYKKVLKEASGYFGSKHRLYKTAHEQVMHSGEYAYRDRRQNKREMRKLWIARINAGARINGLSYSKLMNGLNKAGVKINRKMLSEIAINNPEDFAKICEQAKAAL